MYNLQLVPRQVTHLSPELGSHHDPDKHKLNHCNHFSSNSFLTHHFSQYWWSLHLCYVAEVELSVEHMLNCECTIQSLTVHCILTKLTV